jgi:signal transduction histidine kinase
MKQRSIRQSLLIRIGLCMGILLSALSIWTYLTVRHGLYKELDNAITQTAALLSNQVELKGDKIIFEWQEGQGTNRVLIDEGLFQFWDENTGLTTRSPGLQSYDLPKFAGEGVSPILKDISLPKNRRHARAIGVRVYPFNAPEESTTETDSQAINPKTRPHILVVARDAKSTHRVLNRIRWILSIGTLLALGGLYLLISRVIKISLNPIDDLTNQMKNRTERELDAALELPNSLPSELKGLAENFDSLLKRLATARMRERDFIRHAAHELRTPIAGLRAVTDLVLLHPRSTTEYLAHIITCQKTAIELSELVTRLTALSRIGQQTPALPLKAINLFGILENCSETFHAAFQRKNIKFDWDLDDSITSVIADESLARIIFNNLFDNASCYSNFGGSFRVSGSQEGQKIIIRFSNTLYAKVGDVERLFEPLFRSNDSRHDAATHLGIGLTLSREAASAMNASLTASATPDGWITFTLTL